MSEQLLGPLGALAVTLVMLGLFYTGRILPRNTVAREDFDALRAVNASYAVQMATLTSAVDSLTKTIDRIAPRNGAR